MSIYNFSYFSRFLSVTEFEEILKIQKSEDTSFETILTTYGYVNNLNLYQNLAHQLSLEFVDITIAPGDVSLIDKSKIEQYLKLGFLPYRFDQKKLIIITSQNPINLPFNLDISENDILFKITSPNDIRWAIEYAHSQELTYEACNLLKNISKINNPKSYLKISKILTFLLLTLCTMCLFYKKSIFYLLFIGNIFYFINNIFKTILLIIGFFFPIKSLRYKYSALPLQFPIYTILIPLYKEKQGLEYLIKALNQIDYPKSKLDIKFVLESDDISTIEYIKSKKCPNNYEIIIVPHSFPKTKAKACNYAIKFAKGKYITIFDAEDIPERSQLKKALFQFENGSANLACLQAPLNFYNRKENTLTQMFALEYGLWFEWLLKGLEKLSIPIPLGGTSCHFRTEVLKKISFWDAYNVTEDAELGLRLAYFGYKTEILESYTMEESPIFFNQWLKQRTRWIKGYLQTYMINFRLAINLLFKKNYRFFLSVQLFIGLPSIVFLFNPLNLIAGMILSAFPKIFSPLQPLKSLMICNLYCGFTIPFITSLLFMFYKKWSNKLSCILFPFYWLLHSYAALKAIKEIFCSPFHWNKTPHGLSTIKPFENDN